jgi:plastocyanin
MRFPRSLVAAAVLLCLPPSLARAGEVIVNTGNVGNTFSPSSTTINVGDHVIWIWGTSGHTCTSGATAGIPGPVGPPGNQIQWNSNLQNAGAVFNQKFVNAGVYQYYCGPHAPAMSGVINVSATHVSVPDFRISEIVYGDGANNFVELANLGATGHLEGYLDVNGTIINLSFDMLSGSHAFANAGSATLGLTGTGYVALFVANTLNPNLLDASQIIDYVEWGASGQAREAAAVDAQPTPYWNSGDFLPTMAPGHSMSFCGTSGDYGMGFWSETANRTKFNPNDCASPAQRSTWGRLKSLYR